MQTTFKILLHNIMRKLGPISGDHLYTLAAMWCGLGFSKWWENLAPRSKRYILKFLNGGWKEVFVTGGVISFGVAVYCAKYFKRTSYTNRERYMPFTSADARNDGYDRYQRFMRSKPLVLPSDSEVGVKAKRLFRVVLDGNLDMSEIHHLDWKVFVVTSKEDCFSFGNGSVFLTTRMTDLCANDDQLAYLIARQIAHCILEHEAELAYVATLTNLGCISFALPLWSVISGFKMAFTACVLYYVLMLVAVVLPHSRCLEIEADDIALYMTAKCCFDVKQNHKLWYNLEISDLRDRWFPTVEWLSMHPSYKSHLRFLISKLPKALELRMACANAEE